MMGDSVILLRWSARAPRPHTTGRADAPFSRSQRRGRPERGAGRSVSGRGPARALTRGRRPVPVARTCLSLERRVSFLTGLGLAER